MWIPVFHADTTISTHAYSENKDINLYDRFLVSLIKMYHSFIDEEYIPNIRIALKIASYIKFIQH
jgi:hypothetical protein